MFKATKSSSLDPGTTQRAMPGSAPTIPGVTAWLCTAGVGPTGQGYDIRCGRIAAVVEPIRVGVNGLDVPGRHVFLASYKARQNAQVKTLVMQIKAAQ